MNESLAWFTALGKASMRYLDSELHSQKFSAWLDRENFLTNCLHLEVYSEEAVAKLICQHTGVRINIGKKEYYKLQEWVKETLDQISRNNVTPPL